MVKVRQSSLRRHVHLWGTWHTPRFFVSFCSTGRISFAGALLFAHTARSLTRGATGLLAGPHRTPAVLVHGAAPDARYMNDDGTLRPSRARLPLPRAAAVARPAQVLQLVGREVPRDGPRVQLALQPHDVLVELLPRPRALRLFDGVIVPGGRATRRGRAAFVRRCRRRGFASAACGGAAARTAHHAPFWDVLFPEFVVIGDLAADERRQNESAEKGHSCGTGEKGSSTGVGAKQFVAQSRVPCGALENLCQPSSGGTDLIPTGGRRFCRDASR